MLSSLPTDAGTLPDPDDTTQPPVFDARFRHPGHHPLIARAALPDDEVRRLEAAAQGLDQSQHAAVAAHLAARVERAAVELLGEAGFAAGVERLPFGAGDRIVALGDSITDDACSWAEILRAVLRAVGTDAQLVNAGISGDTTTGAIDRIDLVGAARPSWVIQMLGTNDMRRHGTVVRAPMLSRDESLRNFRLLGDLVTRDIGARLVRMTPAPVIETRLRRWGPFTAQWITWDAADVAALAAGQRAVDPAVVDLHEAFARADVDALVSADGVHPTVAGQQHILRALVRSFPGVRAQAEGGVATP